MYLEYDIFRPSPYDADLDPKITLSYIKELDEIYSEKKEEKGVYKDTVKRLAELPNLSSCHGDTFLKFDLLDSLNLNRNIYAYLRNQRATMSKRCDKELWQEFAIAVNNLDNHVRESVSQLGFHVASPLQTDEITERPLFSRKGLIQGIDKFFAEISKNYAKRELFSKGELGSLYEAYVIGPCRGLTHEFEKIARFYARNYLDKRTLRECAYVPRKWTYLFEICSAVSSDTEKIEEILYKLALKKHERPKAYVFEILDEIGL